MGIAPMTSGNGVPVAGTLVLQASPRARGRCARWAAELAEAAVESGQVVDIVPIARLCIEGCRGCDACRPAPHRCVIRDDMDRLRDQLDAADRLAVVSPVYFSGPPSQLKAVFDRLQPHFWAGTRRLPKRPAALYVVGDGGDPHGYQPLVTITRSALAVAGFSLEQVQERIGAPDGKGAVQ